MRIKIGATKDGRIVAAEGELKYQAGAFAGSPVQPGAMCAFAPYDLEQREGGRLRRRHQPAEGCRLSCAGRTDLRVRGGERGRRDRQEARHRPDRVAPQERRQGGHQGRLRPEVRARRPGRDAGSGQGAMRTGARRSSKNQGRGVASGFWFNIGGETAVSMSAQRGRHAVADRWHARHRRPARLAVHDGGRGARRRPRQDPRADRRHRPARLQLPDRRQPRHLLQRHGHGGGRARGHEGSLQARRPAVGAAGGCRRIQRWRRASRRPQCRQARAHDAAG